MRRHDLFAPKRARTKKHRCRTCRSDNGKRICPALNGLLICPDCCRAKRAKIPGCDQKCRYYRPLLRTSKTHPSVEFPIYRCLVSRSNDTGMLILTVARELPDGNLKAMFVLLDLWKKGLRDCFVDANLSKDDFRRYCNKIGRAHHLAEVPKADADEKEYQPIDLPRDTIVVEAESGVEMDNGVKIVEVKGASGGKAIDSARGAKAVYEINLPKSGKWYVWIRAFFPESKKDSYWIGMDDAEPHPWDEAGGLGAIKIYAERGDSANQENPAWGIWYWDSGVKGESASNSFFEVKTAGIHYLWSKGREPGSILDQILLTRDKDFNVEAVAKGHPIPDPTMPSPFVPLRFAECQKLARYGYDIAKEVKTEIPWEFEYWQAILGDLSKVPKMEGSLYKCPKCGADLPQVAVDLIKEHAQSDDIQFYILCRKCGGEFD